MSRPDLRPWEIHSRLLSADEVKEYFPLRGFSLGLAYDEVGQVHPAPFASGVADAEGITIYEQTPSLGYEEDKDGVRVKTPGGKVIASHVVIATNIEP